LRTGANVQMGVNVDDRRVLVRLDVAEVGAECRLVAAAEDDWDGAGRQDAGDDRAEALLRLLERAADADVAGVEGRHLAQVDSRAAIRGRQAVHPAADLRRGLGRSDSAAVTADAFVLRKADQDGTSGKEEIPVAAPGEEPVAEARVVWAEQDVLKRSRRLQPGRPPGRA